MTNNTTDNQDFNSSKQNSTEFSFSTAKYKHITQPGLTEGTVREISDLKNEPKWMLDIRLRAFKQFQFLNTPSWGADLSGINFDKLRYFLRASDEKLNWDDVPPEVKETFDRLGIPEAERSSLAGVKAQYDSEVVYGSLKEVWEKDGVIFLSMDEGLQKYPDLVKQYFGQLIASNDNKYAALNTAAWSGGSFVYIPQGVEVKMPLQTYFRINAELSGQFERSLIIVEEGASVHYVEGCFTKGTLIRSILEKDIPIQELNKEDYIISHTGKIRKITHTQVRKYTGKLHTITVTGNPSEPIETTDEHPFLTVKRKYKNERNKKWEPHWIPAKELNKNDYLCIPINKKTKVKEIVNYKIDYKKKEIDFPIPSNKDFFRLAGYYLAEGSISSEAYLNFSFHSKERKYIEDVKNIISKLFPKYKIHESHHKKNNGTNVVINSTELCRIFKHFGQKANSKQIPEWMMNESIEKQQQLILGWYRGDGNYYKKQLKHGLKEMFRVNTVSKTLVYQARQILSCLKIASGINLRKRNHENRQDMYTLVIGGEFLINFGKIINIKITPKLNGKKRATFYHIDDNYLYAPIKSISVKNVKNINVYNFGVEKDESYIAGGVAVHNCTAPNFSSTSLHSAVVEVFVKPGATCQYTTIQNWYKNIYNLVTKRAYVEEEGKMIWTDFNMGSKVTMKYPGFILAGKGAIGETLSMALAGSGQHQDTGSKAVHLAPYTSSNIVAKSISKGGGRSSYRGLVKIAPEAHHCKSSVICDALILDPESRTDTYPTNIIDNNIVELQHEATVSKVGDDQLFYLRSRGINEEKAKKMIVNGFIADLVKKLPMEYALEMNKLIDHEMEDSVG